jgi:GT2 family glycosyltransferase
MFFTVIIATCGRPDRLQRVLACIGDAIDRSGEAHCLVVADNHPQYTAEELVAHFSAGCGFDVTYLKTKPFHKSRALNEAIRVAETDWLAFTDDDTLPAAGWLEQGARFARGASFRVFGGRIERGEVEEPVPRLARWREGDPTPGGGVYVYYHPMAKSGALGAAHHVPFGANTFVHRSVYEEYGGYDERLWDLCGANALGIDDGELGVRIKCAGEPIGYCAEALVVHPVYRDKYPIRKRVRNVYAFGWRESIVFPEEYRTPAWRYLAVRVVRQLLLAIGRAVRLRAAPAFAALLEAVRTYGVVRGRSSAAYERRLRLRPLSERQTPIGGPLRREPVPGA